MVPNGPKWSKKINHKFNRMAFITRFNLVLVRSKIVHILTKKSSKRVRHNQVSWSRFQSKAHEIMTASALMPDQSGLPGTSVVSPGLPGTSVVSPGLPGVRG